MSGYLALRGFGALRLFGPVVIATLLSAIVEMIQLYTPHRVCSSVDLATNILGSALGVVAGIAFTRIVDVPLTAPEFHFRDRGAVILLFTWISFLLFPLFPALWFSVWRTKLSGFIHAPLFSPIPTLLSAAEWFAAGRLLIAAGAKSPIHWLLALLLLVPFQFAIINHNPMPSDFEGAAIAALLFYFWGMRASAGRFAGIALLAALTLRALAPFCFEGPPQAFLWIPFGGLLGTEWQNGVTILLGKIFQYGASILLLDRAGLGAFPSIAAVTLVLACIEGLQTRIPGHVPEISDPLIAILLGAGFLVLSPPFRKRDMV